MMNAAPAVDDREAIDEDEGAAALVVRQLHAARWLALAIEGADQHMSERGLERDVALRGQPPQRRRADDREALGSVAQQVPVDEVHRGHRGRAPDLDEPVELPRDAQVHRSVVVNLRAISHVTRGLNDAADIHLRGRKEVLPVSRRYVHLFRQM